MPAVVCSKAQPWFALFWLHRFEIYGFCNILRYLWDFSSYLPQWFIKVPNFWISLSGLPCIELNHRKRRQQSNVLPNFHFFRFSDKLCSLSVVLTIRIDDDKSGKETSPEEILPTARPLQPHCRPLLWLPDMSQRHGLVDWRPLSRFWNWKGSILFHTGFSSLSSNVYDTLLTIQSFFLTFNNQILIANFCRYAHGSKLTFKAQYYILFKFQNNALKLQGKKHFSFETLYKTIRTKYILKVEIL